MRLKILSAVLSLMFFCSCSAVSVSGTGTESLLVAPKLNKRQQEVSDALDASLQFRNIVYKYPQGGDYRSPFIFFDFDEDENDEAVVLYSYANDEAGEVRAKILSQAGAGVWSPVYDVALQTDRVEFVQFQKLLSETESCMLVGCGGVSRGSPSTLQIYSMSGKLEAATEYYNYSVGNFGGIGLSEVVVVGRDVSKGGFGVSLLRKLDERIETVSVLGLASDVEMPLKLTTGSFGSGKALYVDEILQGGAVPTIATEIIEVTRDGLKILAGGDAVPRGEPENPARGNYELTFRNEEIYCMDIDGDGKVEIPFPVPLPGTYDDVDSGVPKLIRLMHLTPLGLVERNSAVINQESGYLVYFPSRWKDNVIVEPDRENNEWHFRKWNPDAMEPAEELLRIRVSSTKDYLDLFEDYTPLAAKGAVSYAAYISNVESETLVVTETEVKTMFGLLPS